MWAHGFCLLFQTFITNNFLYHYAMALQVYFAMALQVSALSKHFIGIMLQVTEWKYAFPILRYDL